MGFIALLTTDNAIVKGIKWRGKYFLTWRIPASGRNIIVIDDDAGIVVIPFRISSSWFQIEFACQ